MANDTIQNLLGSLQAQIKDLGGLEDPLSAGPIDKDLSITTGNKTVKVFDVPVTLDASLDAKVAALAAGAVPDSPFGTTALTAVDGTQYTTLTIDGKITASGKADTKVDSIAVSASGSAKADFSYKHFARFAGNTKRLDALIQLATTSVLPQAADVRKLTDGELLDFLATLNVDFGLQATLGKEADVSSVITLLENLGDGISVPFKAHISFSANAAFGLSLYELTHVTVARAATTNNGFVRIRLERAHRSRIAFGTTIDVSIAYDATAGPQALLDKVYALIPQPQVIETIKKIAAAPADWEGFKKQITGRAVDVVARLVNDTGWKNAAEASDTVKNLIALSKRIVDAYKGLDQKVQSIVEHVLARFTPDGLAKVKPIIQQIAAIKPAEFKLTSLLDANGLLPAQAQQVIQWIEVLTGKDVEELLVSGTVKEELTRAVAAAKQVLAFLDGGASKPVLDEIHKLLDDTGIKGIVDWLSKNATDLATLQAKADKTIADFVTRLVGKAFDSLSADDVKKIQTFAANVEKLLKAPEDLKARLQKGINKLKGTIGFSTATEISRVSEWSAIVDVEIDPKNNDVADATSLLLTGAFADFLAQLDKAKPDAYLIHEILLTSRHLRTSGATISFPFLRFKQETQERTITEETISVTEDDANNVLREGHYFGGAVIRRQIDTRTSEGGAWVRIAAIGKGTNINALYDNVEPAIRLTYVREDTNTTDSSRQSIINLLGELSFGPALVAVPKTLVGKQTRFSLEVELEADALAAFKDNNTEADWNDDVLNAAHRWFLDADRTNDQDKKAGPQMADTVRNDKDFRKLWVFFPPNDDFVNKFGTTLIDPTNGNKNFKRQFGPLQDLMMLRSRVFIGFNKYDANQATSPDPGALRRANKAGSILFRTGEDGWQPPLFNFWFVIGRLKRVKADVLKNARLVTTIRSRATDKDNWSDPQMFAITGISTDNLKV